MKYLIGAPKDFYDFVNAIGKNKKSASSEGTTEQPAERFRKNIWRNLRNEF